MRVIDADRLKAEIMGWCVVTGTTCSAWENVTKEKLFCKQSKSLPQSTLCLWCAGSGGLGATGIISRAVEITKSGMSALCVN